MKLKQLKGKVRAGAQSAAAREKEEADAIARKLDEIKNSEK